MTSPRPAVVAVMVEAVAATDARETREPARAPAPVKKKGQQEGRLFFRVSYRRGVFEAVIIYALGRLGALVSPTLFPGWLFVLLPLLFLFMQYLGGPVWATYRIRSTRRERMSRRFWLLGPLLVAICWAIDLLVSLTLGLAVNALGGVQQGPALWRFFASGPAHLSLGEFALYELRSAVALLAFYTLAVVCTRLAQGGFLRFTMPAGGRRVTL
jgi:hypothetical protein